MVSLLTLKLSVLKLFSLSRLRSFLVWVRNINLFEESSVSRDVLLPLMFNPMFKKICIYTYRNISVIAL